MANHQMLDNISHRDIKIKTGYSAELGDNVSVAGVFPIELNQLQLEYPLFFSKNGQTGQFEIVALLGLDQGHNLFLTEQGWDAEVIPLSIQRQPFLIGFQQRMENGVPQKDPVVTIDIDHPRVNKKHGEAIFLAQGGNSDFLDHINSVLLTIHQGHEQRQALVDCLQQHNLIEPFQLAITYNDGSKQNLQGLYTINEEQLSSLPMAAVVTLHLQGYWQHIYMMLASIGKLKSLIKRKEKWLAATQKAD